MKNLIALLVAALFATGCQLIPASESFATASSAPSTAVTFAPGTDVRGVRAMEAVVGPAWAVTIIGWVPNWSVRFEPDTTSAIGGEVRPGDRSITVHVRERWSDHELARVLAHEICHAADLTRMTPEQRVQWRALRGFSAEHPWWPEGGGFGWMAEEFAEVCALWLVGGGVVRSPWGAPTPAHF